VARSARISQAQQRKLRLAGQGDIRRFFDRVEEFTEKLKARYPSGVIDHKDSSGIKQELWPLRDARSGGLFGRDSLFAKSLASALTAGQRTHYERSEPARKASEYRAAIEKGVARMSGLLVLSNEQRQQLTQLLLKEARPPRTLGHDDAGKFWGIVLVQMHRLPQERLKPLFDRAQWATLREYFKRVPAVVKLFQQEGIDLDEEPRPEQRAEAPAR
jgi:hypothetical protein